MFGSSVTQRASETSTPERTLYRRMDRFEAEGMEAPFGWSLRSNGLRGGQAGLPHSGDHAIMPLVTTTRSITPTDCVLASLIPSIVHCPF
jgi:hypothetical protein